MNDTNFYDNDGFIPSAWVVQWYSNLRNKTSTSHIDVRRSRIVQTENCLGSNPYTGSPYCVGGGLAPAMPYFAFTGQTNIFPEGASNTLYLPLTSKPLKCTSLQPDLTGIDYIFELYSRTESSESLFLIPESGIWRTARWRELSQATTRGI